MDCLFCRIIAGEIPSDKVYEDEDLFAFRDIDPKAPTHILVIPKKHIQSVNEIDQDNADLISKAYLVLKKLAEEEGIAESGYRIVVNINEDGGQSVGHLHFHLLGGRSLSWPPG
ncbi:MAG: histidine triad nucleotide-binding protein [Clostridia bacterium]|nr:histidine triad nucleotide-binding protein [Clostridia bacterium]